MQAPASRPGTWPRCCAPKACWQSAREPISADLAKFYVLAQEVWASGTVDALEKRTAMNFLMDRTPANWAKVLAETKAQSGTCDTAAPVVPDGAMSGTFMWKCEKGRIEETSSSRRPGPSHCNRWALPSRGRIDLGTKFVYTVRIYGVGREQKNLSQRYSNQAIPSRCAYPRAGVSPKAMRSLSYRTKMAPSASGSRRTGCRCFSRSTAVCRRAS